VVSRSSFATLVAAPVAALAALTACAASTSRLPPPQLNQGDPARGAQLIGSYGCGSCHTIAGVPGADGLVGPPLTGIGNRMYIAGRLPTSAENLQRWIRNPQGIDPGNAMPNLGVTLNDARDIAAYLLSTR
jgi:cytochrome c2